MTAPQQDPERYVGSAEVPTRPIPVTAIPYDTQPVPYGAPQLPPVRKRRSMLFYAAMTTVVFMVLLFGVIVGLSLRSGADRTDPHQAVPGAPPATTAPASPAKPADSPRVATEEFLAAVVAGDQAKTNARLCGLLRSSGEGQSGGGLGLLRGLVSYKIGEEHVTGPGAAVDVELTMPLLGAINFDVYLVQEAEGWRVCGAGPA
ncbi:hypothetical protein [Allorhizocola rhizosphaerae]|uniref:hypothetical protein n=1 Tax=Allorhizocola rhizosphaerae TaxID=1872709 RepID=UPI000E3E53BD|nr:hypothetical protein [Allorhizocola rhizosphaerae]